MLDNPNDFCFYGKKIIKKKMGEKKKKKKDTQKMNLKYF